jgi:23S rRNA U2552 (ribose-2'-O)-methylase RlmE/FtsJ
MESFPLLDKYWKHMTLFRKTEAEMTRVFKIESHVLSDIQKSEEEQMLHAYRDRITKYEDSLTNGKNWEYYKKIVNPFELVYTQKKYENFPESICFLKPLSRSYFKMIEMLDLIQFFSAIQGSSIRTAHVCEGPGGFIEALFDEAVKKQKRIDVSVAMTLKSKQSNIPGWKRASNFLQKNKNVRIIFGEDQTGDIMKAINQQYFIDYAIHPDYGGKMDIFTADGGFDFSYDYTKQEQMIFPLLVASTKIGFEVLNKGGVFVLKMFDFYQKSTVDLLYFLSYHFQEWTLYKPGMSRPCNPEHYFIGKGFTGCSDEVLDMMRLWCNMLENNQPLDSLFTTSYSAEFQQIIESLREHSFKSQTEYLKQVFHIIDTNDTTLIKTQLAKNEKSSYDWCVRFHVPIYEHRRRLIEGLHSDPPASYPQ